MPAILSTRKRDRLCAIVSPIWRLGFLLLPTAILVVAGLRHMDMGKESLMLWLGTGFQVGVCFLTFCSRRSWTQALGPSVVSLYLIALTWLWLGSLTEDWFTYLGKAILLVIPLVAFAFQTLNESGA